MTTPAPFPPALETAITEALAEHGDSSIDYAYCRCGYELDGGPLNAHRDLAAHQAAVVMETIAQLTTTEWGVADHADNKLRTCESREDAIGLAGLFALTPVIAVARLVLPWQEVKA